MFDVFDFMMNEKDPQTGYPADGYRLVQRWAWYSLEDTSFNGNLMDREFDLTDFGVNFANYTARFLPVSPIDIFFQRGWTGYRVAELDYRPGEGWMGRGKLLIRLEPSREGMRCSRCGARSQSVHDTTLRRVRDLPILDWDVVLIVPRRRLWCEHCGGPHLEALDWLSPHRRVTRRLEEAIGRLTRAMPLKQVAAFYGVGWHTVKAIDKALLQERVSEPDWSAIEYLGMDEFALHKGHRYATVIVEPLRRQVLWVGQGRSREAIVQMPRWCMTCFTSSPSMAGKSLIGCVLTRPTGSGRTASPER